MAYYACEFKSKVVHSYNSIFDQLNDESLLFVKAIFSNSSSCTVEVQIPNIQKQYEGDDCGVFVIAMMVSLTFSW